MASVSRVIIEHHFAEPMSEEQYAIWAKRVDPCLEARDAVWIRSYLSRDHRHLIGELEAPDAEAIRESYRSQNVPFERVWVAELA